MKVRIKQLMTALATVGIMAGLAVGVAPAANAATVSQESEHRDLGTIGGYHYANFVRITASDTHVRATTNIHTAGTNVPTRYVGVGVTIYRDSQVCFSTGDTYVLNPRPANTWEYVVDLDPSCGAGWYTARGHTAAWNGSAYSYRDTFKTAAVYFDH